MLESLFIERMEGNEEIFTRLMNDDEFRALATEHLVQQVYEQFRSATEAANATQATSQSSPAVPNSV